MKKFYLFSKSIRITRSCQKQHSAQMSTKFTKPVFSISEVTLKINFSMLSIDETTDATGRYVASVMIGIMHTDC